MKGRETLWLSHPMTSSKLEGAAVSLALVVTAPFVKAR
jgi:hypothetical protein